MYLYAINKHIYYVRQSNDTTVYQSMPYTVHSTTLDKYLLNIMLT